MRHLVTGGAGFIGSHLIDRLMSTDTNKVICIDNFQTGTEKNIKQWRGNPRFELVNHDVREPFNVEADQVWHLACPASPDKYQQDPHAKRIKRCPSVQGKNPIHINKRNLRRPIDKPAT
jgi:UDP-glucuronate decarboxylase